MAITNIVNDDGTYTMYGLSTDAKPTGKYPVESVFVEVDTTKVWRFDGANVNPATTNNWWEV